VSINNGLQGSVQYNDVPSCCIYADYYWFAVECLVFTAFCIAQTVRAKLLICFTHMAISWGQAKECSKLGTSKGMQNRGQLHSMLEVCHNTSQHDQDGLVKIS
jgi:hypothetical protein